MVCTKWECSAVALHFKGHADRAILHDANVRGPVDVRARRALWSSQSIFHAGQSRGCSVMKREAHRARKAIRD